MSKKYRGETAPILHVRTQAKRRRGSIPCKIHNMKVRDGEAERVTSARCYSETSRQRYGFIYVVDMECFLGRYLHQHYTTFTHAPSQSQCIYHVSVFLDNKSATPIPHQTSLSLQTSLGDPGESGVLGGMKNKRNMGLQKAKKISKFPNLPN